jgi:hypothetical protein
MTGPHLAHPEITKKQIQIHFYAVIHFYTVSEDEHLLAAERAALLERVWPVAWRRSGAPPTVPPRVAESQDGGYRSRARLHW